jgi:plasmid maintenance system antidote protein VapI
MSFQIGLSDRSKVSARFIRRVHREIQKAFSLRAEEGMTQQQLADKLDVNRATVNKRLLGQDNLTLRSIADLAWALEFEPKFFMQEKSKPASSNTYKTVFAPSNAAHVAPPAHAHSPVARSAGTFVIKAADHHVDA